MNQIFLKIVSTLLDQNFKNDGYFIRVSITAFKKFFLKYVYNVYNFLNSKANSFPNQQRYEMTLDLIGSRIYSPPASKTTKTKPKNLIKLHFVNKGMDMINISKTTKYNNGKKHLPIQFNRTDVYSLTKKIPT